MSEDEELQKIMKDEHYFHASGPLCWGPLQWMTLHQLARGYPRQNPSPEKQAAAKEYVMALIELLPCSICASHWKQIAPSVQTGSRTEFLKWTIDVHNMVNLRKGRPALSYADAVKEIIGHCKNNCLSVDTTKPANKKSGPSTTVIALGVCTALLGAAVLVLILLYFRKSRKPVAVVATPPVSP